MRTPQAVALLGALSDDGCVLVHPVLASAQEAYFYGTAMALAFHPRDPARMHLLTMRGQVLSSADGGGKWTESRLPEGVTWAQAIACG